MVTEISRNKWERRTDKLEKQIAGALETLNQYEQRHENDLLTTKECKQWLQRLRLQLTGDVAVCSEVVKKK